MLGNKGGILDYLDLALFRLAKVGRKRLNEEAELDAFYEEFFTENDDKAPLAGQNPPVMATSKSPTLMRV